MSAILLAMLCMAFASVIGGATGFGTALIATPLMLIAGIEVTEIVVVNLLVGLVTRIVVVVQLRGLIEWRRVAVLGGASIPGAWLGAVTVSMLPLAYLKPGVGALTILCALAMAVPVRGTPPPPSRSVTGIAGLIGGYLSTTTSLNGPPAVLLLSRAKLPPMNFIADLAGYFVITNAVSLALLWLYADFAPGAIWPMIAGCMAVGLLGNRLGIGIARRLPVGAFRSGVIALVLFAGVLTIAMTWM